MRRKLIFVEAAAALWAGWFLVRAVPFRISSRFAGGETAREPDARVQVRARGVARAIAAATGRFGRRETCLMQAFAASLMLRRRHIPSTLRLGVKREGATFAAHAWVMAAGIVVTGGGPAREYEPLADFKGSGLPASVKSSHFDE